MCDTSPSDTSDTSDTSPSGHSINRRSMLGGALAGTGLAIAGAMSASPARAATKLPGFGTPLRPILPVLPSQPTGTVITQLGTAGGPQAEYVRTGTSTVFTVEGKNYLVDCGRSSVTQYLNSGLVFLKLAAIFITHLHADHLADYYNYFLLESGQPNVEGDMLPYPQKIPPVTPPPAQPLPVYGPGPAGALPPQPAPPYGPVPIIGGDNPTPGIKDLTNLLTDGFAYSYNVFMRGDGYQPITIFTSDVNEIAIPASAGASPTNTAPAGMAPFKVFEDDRVQVSAILVPHGSVFPCFAYRFDTAAGSVVFSGDTSCPGFTAATNNVIKLAQGADVLVHEVMNWDLISKEQAAVGHTPQNDPLLAHLLVSHTTTEQVGRVAQAAGVPQLVLTHLIPSNPLDTPDLVWKAKCSVGYSGNVLVGNDGNQIPLPIRR